MSPPGTWRRRLLTLLVLASYVVLAATLHHVRGAVDSGFGSFDDEPAHLVTGLMVHDYLAQGCPGSPLEFAQGFYLHYPKVAIGQWPPVFYGLQGAWMLCFGESGLSLILLMSLLTALVSTIIHGLLAEDLGSPAAWVLGLLFVLMPLVQRYGVIAYRGCNRIDDRTDSGMVLGQHQVFAMARIASYPVNEFVAAYHAQPGKQGRFAAVGVQFRQPFRQ